MSGGHADEGVHLMPPKRGEEGWVLNPFADAAEAATETALLQGVKALQRQAEHQPAKLHMLYHTNQFHPSTNAKASPPSITTAILRFTLHSNRHEHCTATAINITPQYVSRGSHCTAPPRIRVILCSLHMCAPPSSRQSIAHLDVEVHSKAGAVAARAQAVGVHNPHHSPSLPKKRQKAKKKCTWWEMLAQRTGSRGKSEAAVVHCLVGRCFKCGSSQYSPNCSPLHRSKERCNQVLVRDVHQLLGAALNERKERGWGNI